MATARPHVVLLTSPGAGHVLPVLELATRLAAHHGFTATIITYASVSSHSSPLQASLPPGVSVAVLPEVSLDDLPSDAHIVTRILTLARRSLPHLRVLLRSFLDDSPAGVSAFLTDMLCPAALAVAAELGVPRKYVFYTSGLMSLASLLYTPELARTTACECRDLPDPVVLPGCPVPLKGADLVDPLQNRSDPVYPLMVGLGLDYLLADGFLVNTFDAMEHDTLAAFKEVSDKGLYPPAYAVGPFVRACSEEAGKHGSIRWLDGQPEGSVLYVCFGSGGTLSTEQTAELAAGLEASGQRFLWVVQFPSDKDPSAGYLGTTGADQGNSPLNYLPEGFVERTSATGLVVPLWAPQVEVLNHRAVGGFVSHCGWNSALEAAAAGVPMVAWPLYAEQRMNAVLLEERARTALRSRTREAGSVVPRDEVAAVVKELMAGEKGAAARERAGRLRDGAQMASAPGGPQQRALAAVVGVWKGGKAIDDHPAADGAGAV